MKIYTKTGDKGETSLLGGKRVNKSCLEIHVIGEMDELNAALGVAVSSLRPSPLTKFLQNIQRDLFKIGAELASATPSALPLGKREISLSPSAREGVGGVGVKIKKINSDRVGEMEKMIDEFWAELPELKNFILPGGSLAGAHLHQARTICRRVERKLVSCGQIVSLRPELYIYLNRLSDFLFASARWVNFKNGEEEIKV